MVLQGNFAGDSGFRGEEGFSGPFTRSWNGALGDIDEGIINRVRRRVKAFRTHLAIWETRVNTARYNLSRKNTGKNRKRLARMIRERNAKLAQLNAETATLRQMEQELAAQQAAEAASASAGGGAAVPSGGGEEPAAEEAPEAPAEEPQTEGLGAVIERGAQMAGLDDYDAAEIGGLFSGAGEPAYLPLGKLGTPLAVVGGWLLWKKLRKRGRR